MKNRMNLWPHNRQSVEIDVDYYKALPSVPYIEGMKEFIGMIPMSGWDIKGAKMEDIVSLTSGWIDSEEEAEHFARAIEKHCKGIAKAIGNTVYAEFHLYSIFANWDDKAAPPQFIFANWA